MGKSRHRLHYEDIKHQLEDIECVKETCPSCGSSEPIIDDHFIYYYSYCSLCAIKYPFCDKNHNPHSKNASEYRSTSRDPLCIYYLQYRCSCCKGLICKKHERIWVRSDCTLCNKGGPRYKVYCTNCTLRDTDTYKLSECVNPSVKCDFCDHQVCAIKVAKSAHCPSCNVSYDKKNQLKVSLFKMIELQDIDIITLH
jgi:hypothetical protein